MSIKRWITETLLTRDGRVKSKCCSDIWFEKHDHLDKLKLIHQQTDFLSIDVKLPQRIWHIMTDTYVIPKCGNPDCKNIKKFVSYNIGYNRDCSARCAQLNPTVQQKIKLTNSKKYGVEYYTQTTDFQRLAKETLVKKYGVDNISKKDNIRNRRSSRMSDKVYQNKLKEGMISKYGVENPSNIQQIKLRRQTTKRINHFKTYFIPYLKQNNLTYLGTESEYVEGGVNRNKLYKFKCNICNIEFYDHCYSHVPRCEVCFPKYMSRAQSEIYNFLVEIGISNIRLNDKSLIPPLEIDLYLPDYNLAIEYNGLYWHSESSGGKDKNYHLNKTKLCSDRGVQLIHIFEDDWIYKKDIIKSILRSKVHKTNKIYARKCTVKFISTDKERSFLNKTHLQGYVSSKYKIGLFYNDMLVSIMTFGKPRYSKASDNLKVYELLRYSTQLNTSVVGGASKLFSFFIKHVDFDKIISFSDLKFSTGSLYTTLGFDVLSYTTPSYVYFKLSDSYRTYNRIKFQKHKLKNILPKFNITLTEWENMKLNGYDRIWGCGNLKFEYIGRI